MKQLLFVVVSLLLLNIACSTNAGKSTQERAKLYGSWMLKGDKAFTAQLIFGENNRFQLRFPARNESWGGIYLLSEGTVKIWDLYCGSKLPGTYSFTRVGDELALKVLDDPYCARVEFYPKNWIRMTKVTDAQINQWLDDNKKVAEFDAILKGVKVPALTELDTALQKKKQARGTR